MERFLGAVVCVAVTPVTRVVARRGFFGAAGNINPKKMEEEGVQNST
jgi:hypothetical protein